VLRLRGNPPQVQHNRYEIEPFSPGARSTHWTGASPSLGALHGRFVLSGDAILSCYASPSGRYRGFECIQRSGGEDRYTVRGTLLEEDKVISTWSLDLARHS
jgi:hypothetical protein